MRWMSIAAMLAGPAWGQEGPNRFENPDSWIVMIAPCTEAFAVRDRAEAGQDVPIIEAVAVRWMLNGSYFGAAHVTGNSSEWAGLVRFECDQAPSEPLVVAVRKAAYLYGGGAEARHALGVD